MAKVHMQYRFEHLIHPRSLCNVFKYPGYSTQCEDIVTCKKCIKKIKLLKKLKGKKS